jgi:chromosome segregation ATPase
MNVQEYRFQQIGEAARNEAARNEAARKEEERKAAEVQYTSANNINKIIIALTDKLVSANRKVETLSDENQTLVQKLEEARREHADTQAQLIEATQLTSTEEQDATVAELIATYEANTLLKQDLRNLERVSVESIKERDTTIQQLNAKVKDLESRLAGAMTTLGNTVRDHANVVDDLKSQLEKVRGVYIGRHTPVQPTPAPKPAQAPTHSNDNIKSDAEIRALLRLLL